MKVSLDKKIEEDLIQFKIRILQNKINNILKRWNETSADMFIKKAKTGGYIEVENDAIDLKQLLLEEKKLNELLETLFI